MIHCETLDIVFLDGNPLIYIDIPDANEDNVLKGNYIGKPLKAWNFKATCMTKRMTMIPWVFIG